jgi:UDP-2,4-diacetamido-2,4,6-trideoxy-beta-L-altropyranose hydrolase
MESVLMRVLFRAAAGPRIGFGHLVRCRSLARALGVDTTVSVRGSRATLRAAAASGFDIRTGAVSVLSGPRRPDVLVVDDPSAQEAAIWVRRARRLHVPVATIHDLGLGYVDSDLVIDGSIEPGSETYAIGVSGPAYAVLDPSISAARELAPVRRSGVLIALGGGEHVHRWGTALAHAILGRQPDLSVRIVEGFSRASRADDDSRLTWVPAPEGLAHELRRAAVAIVAGGLTLYEAAALGTPCVAMAVVAAQRPTIRGFATRGAAIDAGIVTEPEASDRVADAVAYLLARPTRAARLGGTAACLVDGCGVFRAAEAIRQLARRAEDQFNAA